MRLVETCTFAVGSGPYLKPSVVTFVTGPYRTLCDALERLPFTTLLLPGLPAISAIEYNEMSQFCNDEKFC